jgi:hypothetical protein
VKDIAKMRLGVLRELKEVRRFLDYMELSVKNRNHDAIHKAYIFLTHLVHHMDKGFLCPDSISLDADIANVLDKFYKNN